MAATEYVPVYRGTRADAARNHEKDLWEQSFRENVCCARAIEKGLREGCDILEGRYDYSCVKSIIEDYGIRRVEFVLAHSILEQNKKSDIRNLFYPVTVAWAESQNIPHDPTYGRFYKADTAGSMLESFLREVHDRVRALALFGDEHCSAGMYEADVTGKVLVMKPNSLKEQYWSRENQLWLAQSGFGCDPKARGRAIYAHCLVDGKEARWDREDFCGVLDEQYLPEWAREKLEALRAPEQEQAAAPAMSGMEM